MAELAPGLEAPVANRALVDAARAHSRAPKRSPTRSALTNAVLVEPPAPVGAAEVRPVAPVDLTHSRLRLDPRGRVHRVRVGDRADHVSRVDRLGAVERHAELALGAQRLKPVHVVGDGARGLRLGRAGGSSSSPTRAGGGAASARRCGAPPRWADTGSRRGSRAHDHWHRAAAPAPDPSGSPGRPRRSALPHHHAA